MVLIPGGFLGIGTIVPELTGPNDSLEHGRPTRTVRSGGCHGTAKSPRSVRAGIHPTPLPFVDFSLQLL
jgi:hypothetical protein